MKKVRVLCLACVLAMMLFGCGKAEQSEQLSSEEQELQQIEEMIVDLLEQRAENEAAAATAETDGAESTESVDDIALSADNEIAERVTAYYMGEELLDNKFADNMNEPTIERIRDSGKQVKFMKFICVYEEAEAGIGQPSLITDTVKSGMYGVSPRQLNELTEDCWNYYYMFVVTCPEDVNYTDFKASWEFYGDMEKTMLEATLEEEIVVDDGSLLLDGLETANIYNFDGNYYALCRGFESFNSSTDKGITTDVSGLRFVLLKGDKSQLDFSRFSLDTTLEPAKAMLDEMKYESLGRFPNRDWMCNHGYHPAYDLVVFQGSIEKTKMEAYYILLADYIAETGYKGGHDFIVSYTNNDGEVIDIIYYGNGTE